MLWLYCFAEGACTNVVLWYTLMYVATEGQHYLCASCSELGRVDSNVYDATAKVFIILWTFPPSSLAIAVLTVSCVHRDV